MKNNSNTSRGLSEMGTVGPTSDVKSLIRDRLELF